MQHFCPKRVLCFIAYKLYTVISYTFTVYFKFERNQTLMKHLLIKTYLNGNFEFIKELLNKVVEDFLC